MQDEHSRQNAGLTRMPRPTLSQTTGHLPTAQRPSNGTGMQRSEPGAAGTAVTPMGRWQKQQLGPFELPEATMRSLSDSLTSALEVSTTSRFGSDGQFDGLMLAPFRIKPGMTQRQLLQDLLVVDEACAPAPKHLVVDEVALLKARTRGRAEGEGEAAFSAEVMVGDLSKYPLDVVRYACAYWIDGGRDAKWFPSWPELKVICDRRMDGRLRLKKALIRMASETGV